MRPKSFFILGVVGALTIPAGLALASIDMEDTSGNGPSEVVETIADPVRDQDRIQLQEPGQCSDCAQSGIDGAPLQQQTQSQVQARIHDPEDCDGEPIQRQERIRTHTQIQTEVGAQTRSQNGLNSGNGQHRDANSPGPRGPEAGGGPAPSAGSGDCPFSP